jgi:hypothetical protein
MRLLSGGMQPSADDFPKPFLQLPPRQIMTNVPIIITAYSDRRLIEEGKMSIAVDHLKKVTLEIQTDTRKGKLEFICGAASDGFCPFEYELLHKTPGDQLHLSVPRDKAVLTFAHLYKPLQKAVGIVTPAETIDLNVSVISISDPEPREIIQALAQATDQNGCGGDCGCGCGGC